MIHHKLQIDISTKHDIDPDELSFSNIPQEQLKIFLKWDARSLSDSSGSYNHLARVITGGTSTESLETSISGASLSDENIRDLLLVNANLTLVPCQPSDFLLLFVEVL